MKNTMKKTGSRLHVLRTAAVSAALVCAMTAGALAADAGIITGDVVNVRKGPGTGYDRVEQLAKGRQVSILAEENGWYKIAWNNSTGYVSKSYVSASGASVSAPADVTPNATVTGGNINVRIGPGTGYDRIAVVGTGKRVTLLGEEGGWVKIGFDGKVGYLLGTYLTPDAGAMESVVAAEAAADDFPTITVEAVALSADDAEGTPSESRPGVITGGTINVRVGPSTDSDRITQVSTGKKVTILGEENGWFQIGFDGKTGYVLSKYVYEGESLPVSSVGQQVAAMAAQYVGTRYVYGGAAPGGFDCSGFTLYLYKQFGYSLPHTASGQYANCGVKVSRSELQPGDLVFFTSSGSGGRITHVGVYTGNDQIIHARYSVGKVYVNYLYENYYNKNYVGAIRLA